MYRYRHTTHEPSQMNLHRLERFPDLVQSARRRPDWTDDQKFLRQSLIHPHLSPSLVYGSLVYHAMWMTSNSLLYHVLTGWLVCHAASLTDPVAARQRCPLLDRSMLALLTDYTGGTIQNPCARYADRMKVRAEAASRILVSFVRIDPPHRRSNSEARYFIPIPPTGRLLHDSKGSL